MAILISIILFILSSPIYALDFSGPVVSAFDGNTLEFPHHQHPERIRLNGINCPEKGRAFGKQAKHAVADLAFGKEVTLQTHCS